MTEGNIFILLLKFSIPLILTTMLQLLFNAADVVVVGRFAGKQSLAAVGSVGSLTNLIVNLAVGVSQGCNIVCSRAFGAKDKKSIYEIVHTSLALSLIFGIVIMFIGLTFSKQILVIMGSPKDVIDLAALYLRIYFAGIIPILVYNFCSSILRAVGDTKRPFIYILVSGIINITLNIIFVVFLKMGVAGVALATVIAWTVAAILILRTLIKTKESYRLVLKEITLYKNQVKKILAIGIPTGIQGMTFSISNVVVMSAVNSLGTSIVAGNAAASNIEGFVWCAMDSVAIAAMTFVSQNYGAKKFKRNTKGFFSSLSLVFAVGFILGNLSVAFARPLLSIYTTDELVVELGRQRLVIICGTYYIAGFMQVASSAIKGYGYAVISTAICLIGSCFLRLVWVWTVFDHYHSYEYLLYCYPITWALTFVVCFFYYLYAEKRVKNNNININ